MIVFRHCVTGFGNITLECEGHSGEAGTSLPCAAASALMAAAAEAMRRRNPPRLKITTGGGLVELHCKYDIYTAEIAMVTVCGFEWLAKQAPGEVVCERFKKY